MTIGPKRKTLILPVVFVTAFVLAYIFLLQPALKDIQNLSSELAFVKRSLSRIVREERQVSLWVDNKDQFEKDIEKVETFFVNPNLPVEFVEFLESASEKSGTEIEISLLKSSEEEGDEEKRFFPIRFRLSVRGGFSNCMAFVERMESAPYLLEIQRLDITKEMDGGGRNVTLSTLVEVFALYEPEES